MSELIERFQKRKETIAMNTVQRHLALTTGIVSDLERAIGAANRKDEKVDDISACDKVRVIMVRK